MIPRNPSCRRRSAAEARSKRRKRKELGEGRKCQLRKMLGLRTRVRKKRQEQPTTKVGRRRIGVPRTMIVGQWKNFLPPSFVHHPGRYLLRALLDRHYWKYRQYYFLLPDCCCPDLRDCHCRFPIAPQEGWSRQCCRQVGLNRLRDHRKVLHRLRSARPVFAASTGQPPKEPQKAGRRRPSPNRYQTDTEEELEA